MCTPCPFSSPPQKIFLRVCQPVQYQFNCEVTSIMESVMNDPVCLCHSSGSVFALPINVTLVIIDNVILRLQTAKNVRLEVYDTINNVTLTMSSN